MRPPSAFAGFRIPVTILGERFHTPQGKQIMAITVEAVYENGTLKLKEPLPLKEHETVRITVEPALTWAERTAGMLPCDPALIEWAATDPDLAYPESRETP